MEDIIVLDNNNGFVFGMLNLYNQYFIVKQILDKKYLPKGVKILNKPNFSYYPSINSLSNIESDDDLIKNFPKESISLEVDNVTYDAEIIMLSKGFPTKLAKMVFEILSKHAYVESMYDIVCDLENIFGLVWKVKKTFQIGLIGELLFIKNNPDFISELSNSFHLDELKNKKLSSKTDFEVIKKDKSINIEVKTTTSLDGYFTIKNDQLSNKLNDYYAAIKINIVKKGGKTLVDLINWYLEIPQLSSEIKFIFEDIKRSSDDRTLLSYDDNNYSIRLINVKDIPYIENPSDKILNINYKIDLFSLPSVELNEIL